MSCAPKKCSAFFLTKLCSSSSCFHCQIVTDILSPAELEQEIRILVEETKSPKSADELLRAYAGREADLLKNLRKMKALQDKNDAIRAEVADLCEKVNSPKSPDELLSSYKGREDELLKNLRKLSFKQQVRRREFLSLGLHKRAICLT